MESMEVHTGSKGWTGAPCSLGSWGRNTAVSPPTVNRKKTHTHTQNKTKKQKLSGAVLKQWPKGNLLQEQAASWVCYVAQVRTWSAGVAEPQSHRKTADPMTPVPDRLVHTAASEPVASAIQRLQDLVSVCCMMAWYSFEGGPTGLWLCGMCALDLVGKI